MVSWQVPLDKLAGALGQAGRVQLDDAGLGRGPISVMAEHMSIKSNR